MILREPIPSCPVNWPSSTWGILLFLLGTTLLSAVPRAEAQNEVARIEFLKYGSMATTVAQSDDGALIAIGTRESSQQGRVVLWSLSQQQRVWSRSFSTSRAPDVALNNAGSRLAVATGQGSATIWRIEDGMPTAPRDTSATDVEFGPGGTLGTGGDRIRVQMQGMDEASTLTPDASARDVAFRRNASELAFAENDTQVTFWNYGTDTSTTLETSSFCDGRVIEIKLPGNSDNIYFTTRAYATCDPDYLCIVNPTDQRLVRKYKRKNISQIEPMGEGTLAYSRGRYVYQFDLGSGAETIVFESRNEVQDLSYANGHLVIANSDVVVLEL